VSARLVVLASGAGSTLGAVLDAVASGQLPAEVVAVGSDRPGCPALARAEAAGVPTFAVPLSQFADRADWNLAFARALADHRPDLVVCAGFMRVFGPSVVHRFRIVNTHPALLPAFKGWHGVRDALDAGVKVTGCTVHVARLEVDDGPILAQEAVPVLDGDTVETLHERIKAVERRLYPEVLRTLAEADEPVASKEETG